ncbi:MAG: hypothetical protein KME13_21455 [Myxacorys californica WJT36-NPBG1]|nr:hypothetical protein [Myxacorys californica WJT36-NPBG1]
MNGSFFDTFQVKSLEFRVAKAKDRVLNLEFRAKSLKFRLLSLEDQVPSLEFRAKSLKFHLLDLEHRVPSLIFQVKNLELEDLRSKLLDWYQSFAIDSPSFKALNRSTSNVRKNLMRHYKLFEDVIVTT